MREILRQSGTKEMMQPCLVHLILISLVALMPFLAVLQAPEDVVDMTALAETDAPKGVRNPLAALLWDGVV